MKINFLINSLQGGGTEKVCCQIASDLADRGRKVNVYVLDDNGAFYHISKNVNVIYLGKATTSRSFGKIYRLIKNIKDEGGRLLVFNHELALVSLLVKRLFRLNVRIVSRINNTFSATIKYKSLKYRMVLYPLMKVFYRYIDGFIFQSQGIKEDMINNYGVKQNFKVINNPVHKVVLTEYKNSPKNDYILFVGRLVEQKNVDDTIKAFKEFSRQVSGYKLKIVGDGPEKERLMNLCKQLGVGDSVEFLGYQRDTLPLFYNAAVTVLSSYNEGFPNVLLESLAVGTPIVSYDCPSGPRDIIEKDNGILVEHLNIRDLATGISQATSKEWDSEKLANTLNKYSIEHITKEYYDFIK
ncbi:glycosyltransferase [Salinivibrio kushneri]|uniref:Glycosyltransferase n=1 Tax=Salinivibrio kushneri TaxID=1908198 RepID=A0AA47KJ86_9GAMM|nr:glycosyltransferase [Salinivibrio kushneri]WBA07858.1 glycosyltransferase [Salinivibrio kushneri]